MNEFFRCTLESNPFADTAVGETADAVVHVESLHRRQLQQLVACAEDVRRTGRHQGRVVWGDAGSGKSHLLVQFERWVRREDVAFCPIVRHLDADADKDPWRIVKSVLRQMTRDFCARCPLLGTSACPLVHTCDCRPAETPLPGYPSQTDRPADGGVSLTPWRQMPLYQLVRAAVKQACVELPEGPSPYCAGQVLDVFHRLVGRQLQRLNGSGPEADEICDLLFRFFLAAQRTRQHPGADGVAIAAVKWLSGEPLDLERAAQLGVRLPDRAQQSVSLSQVAAAQTVLVALAELALLSNRALVLCFDQVDGLSHEQAGALARFLDPLASHARNLMVVLSGEQRAMLDLVDRGIIGQATWEHLNPDGSEILLSRIRGDQARRVLHARLRRFVEPFLTLPRLRRRIEQDALFPLGSEWFAERVGNRFDMTPREVLRLAAERWREQQARLVEVGGPAWFEIGRTENRERTGGIRDAETRRSRDAQGGEPKREREDGSRQTKDAAESPGPSPKPLLSSLPAPASSSGARRAAWCQEIAGWSTTAVLVVAIVLVLWARSNGLMDADGPAPSVAIGWDKRSAGLPEAGASQGGPAHRPPQATESAEGRSLAVADDRDNNDGQDGHDAALPATTPGEPPAVIDRIGPPANPAATRPAPPVRGMPKVGQVANVSAPQRRVGIGRHNPVPLVPPAPLAPSVAASRAVSSTVAATVAAEIAPSAGDDDAGAEIQPLSSADARRRAVRLGQTAAVASLAGPADFLDAEFPVKPLAVSASPEVERFLDEAWGLIERGDLGPGRTRLLAARKADAEDPRADFSLGLLDGLTKQDWDSAAKHFGECLRRDRGNIPALNNLAIVLVQGKREGEAAKHWKAIVSQRPATVEVVQNVGIVRHLMDEGMIRKNSSLRKSLEHLYTEAAVATSTTCQVQAGFRFMNLVLTDGRTVGFASPKKMQLAVWSPAPEATPAARPIGPQPPARATGSAMARPEQNDGRVDQRVGPTSPHVPQGAPPTNVPGFRASGSVAFPASRVFTHPAADFPFVTRPGYKYPPRQ